MVKTPMVSGHVFSEDGIEVNNAKTCLIVDLSAPTYVKEVRFFLDYVGFYHCFTKDLASDHVFDQPFT